jgi:hypothetical protein
VIKNYNKIPDPAAPSCGSPNAYDSTKISDSLVEENMKKKTRDQESAPWEEAPDEQEEMTSEGPGNAPASSKAGGPASAKARSRWKPSLLGYRWIMKNIRFFLFLAALAVIYIYNGHYADKVVRDINRTSKELKELQYEYKTLKSEVMFRSKQSELAKAVEPFGLKELTLPPYVLTDSTEKNKN